MAETSAGVIARYLEDAIAVEKAFEARLNEFAGQADVEDVRIAFHEHALETKNQHERLTARLEALGGTPSRVKGLLAHIFESTPKLLHTGQQKEERTTQNLIVAFALENSDVAMYESLAAVSEAAGDSETESLARSIQAQERAAAERIWSLLQDAARIELQRATSAIA